MLIQLIRNATLRITYGGRTFLLDPYLAAKHTRPSFTGVSLNPLVDLPCTPQEAIANCEIVLISHLHSDHFDSVAQSLLPKDVPIFCQPGDETAIAEYGFQQVTPLAQSVVWNTIKITRTSGQHGSGDGFAANGSGVRFSPATGTGAELLLGRRYHLV